MKAYAKIFSVALAFQFTLAAVETSLGDDLIARSFTATSNTDTLVARAITAISNTDSLAARAITAISNTDSLVARAITAISNIDSLVARAFTAVNCEEGAGGLCADCNGDAIPDECALDCGEAGGPCDIPGCGQSNDCDDNGVPDSCEGCGECPADADCDGQIGAFDLAVLLGNWGPVTPGSVCLDADEDGLIGAFDLAVLLGAWGICP